MRIRRCIINTGQLPAKTEKPSAAVSIKSIKNPPDYEKDFFLYYLLVCSKEF